MKKIKQVRIEEVMWQRAKGAAALKGMTLEAWMTAAIEGQLAAQSLLEGFTEADKQSIREAAAKS